MKNRLFMMGVLIIMMVLGTGLYAQVKCECQNGVAGSGATCFLSTAGTGGTGNVTVFQNTAGGGYSDFNGGQRFGTWALNFFVWPGLGSFIIMHDFKGGIIQLIMGTVGYGLVGGSIPLMAMGGGGFIAGISMLSAGGGLWLATLIYNIVRTATYHRPSAYGSLIDPSAWNLAIVPGAHGIEKVSLAYTLRLKG